MSTRKKLAAGGIALLAAAFVVASDDTARPAGGYSGGAGHSVHSAVQNVAYRPGGHDHGYRRVAGTTTSAATTTAPPTTTSAPAETSDSSTTTPTSTTAPATSTTSSAGAIDGPPPVGTNGLEVLGRDCTPSDLADHTGFQVAPACVGTAFGEVGDAAHNPSLLIVDAPRKVKANKAFKLAVSTRNLVRDRFLGAAAGGYYLESSFLNDAGLQRGHFHTACRILPATDVAPDAAPAPAFFVATQDNGGGATPDTVVITVPGLPAGNAQCAVWAGDGSHRIPMMQRANQTPAFDSVRIKVGGRFGDRDDEGRDERG